MRWHVAFGSERQYSPFSFAPLAEQERTMGVYAVFMHKKRFMQHTFGLRDY